MGNFFAFCLFEPSYGNRVGDKNSPFLSLRHHELSNRLVSHASSPLCYSKTKATLNFGHKKNSPQTTLMRVSTRKNEFFLVIPFSSI